MRISSISTSLSLLGVLAASLVAASCGGEAQGAPPATEAVVPVRVAPVGDAGTTTVTATGTLGSKDEIPLAFKIGGVVSRVTVDEGARVRAGQLLAELDLREIDAAVSKATAGAEKARRDAARIERLYHDSVATLAQWQDAQTAREAADADLRAARVNREFAVITAPSNGVVLRRSVNAGTQITSGSPVVVFGSDARGSVLRVGLPDKDAVRVHQGDRASITFDAYPGRAFSGRVRQTGAAADPRTGTFVTEIAVDGGDALPRGLLGRVRIDASGTGRARPEGIATIPAEALVEGAGDRGVVYTVDAPRRYALRREVTLVGVDGERVLVRGLGGVTHVVTAGAAWLRDSARVEVKP